MGVPPMAFLTVLIIDLVVRTPLTIKIRFD